MLTQINSSSKVKHRRWQKDSEAKDCPHCQSMFTFLTRKHHCRLCGFVVCGACSRHKSPLPTLGYYKSVRVCDKCVFKHISNKSPEKLCMGHFPKSLTNLTSTLRFNNRKFCLSFRKFLEVFGRVRTHSDPFGRAGARSDAFGSVWAFSNKNWIF